MAQQNWFETLSQSLEAENIQGWSMITTIHYGETAREFINGECVVIYRNEKGMYERPVHYKSQMSC